MVLMGELGLNAPVAGLNTVLVLGRLAEEGGSWAARGHAHCMPGIWLGTHTWSLGRHSGK